MKDMVEQEMLLWGEEIKEVSRWKQYRFYKAVDSERLNVIPEHWSAIRLKYVAHFSRKKLLAKPDELLYVGLEQIESQTGKLLLDVPVDTVESIVSVFDKGNVLFGKLRPYLAKVMLADFRGVCTSELIVLQPTESLASEYLFYRLLSNDFISLVNSFTYGTKMPRASSEQIGNIVIQHPPLAEQRAIAAFLDRETAKINALIAKRERMIELLQERRAAVINQAVTKGLNPAVQMKDSGVEWLGEIPEHWEVKRLKFVANVMTGATKGKDLAGKEVIDLPYLRVANVQSGYLDLSDVDTITVSVEEVERYLLKPGDVLMNEGGDNDKLGRGFTWDGSIDPCLHQNHVFAVRPLSTSDSAWISTITQTNYAKHYFTLKAKQSTNLASISKTNIQNLPLVLPPPEERSAILAYLDQETIKIDKLITGIQGSIQKLREYRVALISAAVTGKIDVRGEVGAGQAEGAQGVAD